MSEGAVSSWILEILDSTSTAENGVKPINVDTNHLLIGIFDCHILSTRNKIFLLYNYYFDFSLYNQSFIIWEYRVYCWEFLFIVFLSWAYYNFSMKTKTHRVVVLYDYFGCIHSRPVCCIVFFEGHETPSKWLRWCCHIIQWSKLDELPLIIDHNMENLSFAVVSCKCSFSFHNFR